MKTKYDRMTKEEKKNLKGTYMQNDNGASLMKRLSRLNIIGILCILYALINLITEFKSIEAIDLLLIVPLFLVGIFFILMSHKIKRRVLVNFAVSKK